MIKMNLLMEVNYNVVEWIDLDGNDKKDEEDLKIINKQINF
jgi:hypothetical protein